MPNITEEKWIEMLEKKADGTYIAKYPKVKSKSGITFDEHLAEKASEIELGHVRVDGSTITIDGNGIISIGSHARIIEGAYVGNETNRNIVLGVTPKLVIIQNNQTGDRSVYVMNSEYTLKISSSSVTGDITTKIIEGGFVLTGSTANMKYMDYIYSAII